MAKVERLEIPDARRVVVISDIHGNLPYLQGLLAKVPVRPDDLLILLGDLVEKGPDSLATLRYVMGLRSRYDLRVVQGNCDAWHLEMDLPDQRIHYWVRNYMLRQKPGRKPGLLVQMCQECGVPLGDGLDMEYMRSELKKHFVPELDFLRSLPHILESEKYVFVHGGLPPEGVPWSEAPGWTCMKNDRFARQGRRFDRWVIAGHTPVQLYREDITCAMPLIDEESHIISIDGGCVLKDDGQLNALLIENGRFRTVWYDPFPLCRALDPQTASETSRYIPWGDNQVEELSRDGEFVRIRHRRTGYEMDVPADFLFERDGELRVNDCTDYRPAIAPGDVVSLVRRTSRGAWIKKDGVSGWYAGRLEPSEP